MLPDIFQEGKSTTILEKRFGTKKRNSVKLDRTRKV